MRILGYLLFVGACVVAFMYIFLGIGNSHLSWLSSVIIGGGVILMWSKRHTNKEESKRT
ncbi:hypothetical protein SAMN05421737_10799 [Shouchella lonarensis]|uniref:Uncharacterized protein n=1 Tax=Shouchella lonarensis TaxID=1464122 RepID=A0A1G6KNP9_9BACI|nr:hypothetical protein SAMN05421737_10799 [Shouchella lonarensis]